MSRHEKAAIDHLALIIGPTDDNPRMGMSKEQVIAWTLGSELPKKEPEPILKRLRRWANEDISGISNTRYELHKTTFGDTRAGDYLKNILRLAAVGPGVAAVGLGVAAVGLGLAAVGLGLAAVGLGLAEVAKVVEPSRSTTVYEANRSAKSAK